MKRPRITAWISPRHAAQHAGLAIPTVYRWIKQGHVKCRVMNVPRIRVRLKDVEHWKETSPKYYSYRPRGLAAAAEFRARRMEKQRHKLAQSWTREGSHALPADTPPPA